MQIPSRAGRRDGEQPPLQGRKINSPGLGPNVAERGNIAAFVFMMWTSVSVPEWPQVPCVVSWARRFLAVGGFHAQLAPLTERAPFFVRTRPQDPCTQSLRPVRARGVGPSLQMVCCAAQCARSSKNQENSSSARSKGGSNPAWNCEPRAAMPMRGSAGQCWAVLGNFPLGLLLALKLTCAEAENDPLWPDERHTGRATIPHVRHHISHLFTPRLPPQVSDEWSLQQVSSSP